MKTYSLLLILVFAPFLKICSPGDGPEDPKPHDKWEKLGLSDLNVSEIKFHHNLIFAATSDGLYKKNVASPDTTWQPIGLQRQDILDFVLFSPDEIIACADVSTQPKSLSIYRTTDGGMTWEPYQNGFGGELGKTCYAIDHNPDAPDTLFARASYAVAKSTDRGQSWQPVLGDWGLIGYQSPLIKINENNPNIVWAGGENVSFSPYLARSTDYGNTWVPKPVPSNGDNAVYDIAIKKNNSEVVLVGMEGQLLRSVDGGDNFEIVLEPTGYPYFNTLERCPLSTTTVYTSGSENGTSGGQLFFYRSTNFGNTWTKVINDEDPVDEIATRDLEAHIFTVKPGLYMATNKGVWRYCSTYLLSQSNQTVVTRDQ